jgi:hypothetical protein
MFNVDVALGGGRMCSAGTAEYIECGRSRLDP